MAKTKNTYFPCPGPVRVWLKKKARAKGGDNIAAEIRQILIEAKKSEEDRAQRVAEGTT